MFQAELSELKDLKDLKYVDFSQFVRWQDLEDGLKGIRSELEKLRDMPERVVIEMSSQTVEVFYTTLTLHCHTSGLSPPPLT